jgi:hypothetical protein
MTSAILIRRASVALAALTLACGDSTGPNANLSEEQVGDMLDAMSAVASFSEVPDVALSSALVASPRTANATMSFSQTVDCPNGGSANVSGTTTDDEATGQVTAQVTHSFNGCAATSSEGRVWTFNGNPNIVTNMSASFNETTGAFTMTTTQVGGVRFTSDVGSGVCQINLTFTMSGNETSLSGSLSGTACGHNIQQSFEYSE